VTREETAKLIEWYRRNLPAMEAYRDGVSIEYESHAINEWCDATAPGWAKDYEYRIKPAPKLRPYNREECEALVGKPLRFLAETDKRISIVNTVVGLMTHVATCGKYLPEELLRFFEHLDGQPCGVVE